LIECGKTRLNRENGRGSGMRLLNSLTIQRVFLRRLPLADKRPRFMQRQHFIVADTRRRRISR
jgi:hypothetical protein